MLRDRCSRFGFVLVLGMMCWSVTGLYLGSHAHAQEVPPANPPAAAPADPAASGTPPAPTSAPSALRWLIETSGLIGGFLLLISIYFVAKVTQLFVELRRPTIIPEDLLTQCNALASKRDFNGAYALAREDPSELGQLIAAGLAALPSGLDEARDTIDRLGEIITVEMEKKISMLAVIGTLGPMIGLLGTLKGMIGAFGVIAMSDTQLKAGEVAGHISEALVLTFEGVALSVPAIYFFAFFKNRISTLSLEAINTADEFIRRVYMASRTRPAADEVAGTPPKRQ